MEYPGNRTPVKIRNRNDLRLAKQACRYDLKIREEALGAGFKNFQYAVKDTLRSSLLRLGQKAVYFAMLKLVQRRLRRKKNKSKT